MAKPRSGLPRHCSWAWDRHGKKRIRFRKDGFSTYIAGTPYSAEFNAAYAAALDGLKFKKENIGADRTKPGSIDALIVAYYKSAEFRGTKASTQQKLRSMIERFRSEHGTKPARLLARAHVKAIIGAKADTPAAANNLLKALRPMFNLGVDIGMMEVNPAIGVKPYKIRSDGFHVWDEAEIAQFQQCHPLGTKARLAHELLLGTAQRVSDVVRAGWQHVKRAPDGDVILFRQEKTGTFLEIPIGNELATALAKEPKTNLTFLLTEWGGPFSANGFSHWFRKQCNKAGLPHCSAHGLRKSAATRLADAGCSAEQIKAITGHQSLTEVARYTKKADQKRLAKQARATQERAKSEQKTVQPTEQVGQKRG